MDNLPSELVLRITTFVPLEDAVCLALCNRHLYNNVGRTANVLGALLFHHEAKRAVLQRLDEEADMKWQLGATFTEALIYCDDCSKVHSILPTPPIRPSWNECELSVNSNRIYPRLNGRVCGRNNKTFLHDEFSFSCVQFLVNLKRARQQSLVAHYANALKTQKRGGSISYPTALDFRVVVGQDANVYIRRQEWLSFPLNQKLYLTRSMDVFAVCAHQAFSTIHDEYADSSHAVDGIELCFKHINLTGLFPTALSDYVVVNTPAPWARFPLRSCEHCPSEYRLDFGVVSENQGALVLTKWMCLGDAQEALWEKHMETFGRGPFGIRMNTFQEETQRYEYEAGSVFKAFEGHDAQHRYRPRWNEAFARIAEEDLAISEIQRMDYGTQLGDIYRRYGTQIEGLARRIHELEDQRGFTHCAQDLGKER